MKVTISVKWWVVPYLRTLGWFALLVNLEPDMQRVMSFVCKRGLKFTAVRDI